MSGFTIRQKVDFSSTRRRARTERPEQTSNAPGRVPRVSRIVALAIRIDQLLSEGTIGSLAEAGRLTHVTRARMSQILNLTNLAPDIIEAILFLPRIESGRDPINERDLRPIASELNWTKQRAMWRDLIKAKRIEVAV